MHPLLKSLDSYLADQEVAADVRRAARDMMRQWIRNTGTGSELSLERTDQGDFTGGPPAWALQTLMRDLGLGRAQLAIIRRRHLTDAGGADGSVCIRVPACGPRYPAARVTYFSSSACAKAVSALFAWGQQPGDDPEALLVPRAACAKAPMTSRMIRYWLKQGSAQELAQGPLEHAGASPGATASPEGRRAANVRHIAPQGHQTRELDEEIPPPPPRIA